MVAIVCPSCGSVNKLSEDENEDCVICASCGRNYDELEEEDNEDLDLQ